MNIYIYIYTYINIDREKEKKESLKRFNVRILTEYFQVTKNNYSSRLTFIDFRCAVQMTSPTQMTLLSHSPSVSLSLFSCMWKLIGMCIHYNADIILRRCCYSPFYKG